ncbi:L-type lectin-domain containing receptor kinase S.4-like [Populus nigra]|uniref:L-type lectin-domain containing receptor kinase S.4-like n=1 Tax=Populus nigra TaxID=3691 RepID=UPI002B275518|nr:L-type lectin-domain containing receptor kinase S.4-like [Populus nigra]
MAAFPVSRSTLPFNLLVLVLHLLCPISTFSLVTLTSKNPNFDPQIALLGDAKVSNDGSHVLLTSPFPSSSGLLMYKHPFKFPSFSPAKATSFSTEFSFSISGKGNGLSLLMGSRNFALRVLGQGKSGVLSEKSYLGVEIGSLSDSNVGDFNASLVAVGVSNASSSVHLETNTGEKLKSWVDYKVSLKRLEVRLSKVGDERPHNPTIAYSIDLSKMWGDNEVYVALQSFNGKSLETCVVYSWRFRLRKVPNRMHSLPADPHGYVDEPNEELGVHKRRFCPLSVLAGIIFVTGCGAMLAFAVLFVWAVFVNRHTVFPTKGNVKPVDFKYEKISVVVEKDGEVVKS